MSYSFDQALATERDEFRSRLDDTDATAPYFSDEVVDALILKLGLGGALLVGVNTILLRLGKKVTSLTSSAGAKFTWSERVKVYRELKAELLAEGFTQDWAIGDETGSGRVIVLALREVDEEFYLPIVEPDFRVLREEGLPLYGPSPTIMPPSWRA